MSNKERQRQWRKDNPDKVKTYRRDYLRRKYLAEMLEGRNRLAANQKKEGARNAAAV